MLQKKAIETTTQAVHISRLFSVPKKGTDRLRMILDLSYLNCFICRPKFKMTTVNHVREIISLGAWMATIDLKDAYWHVPIHQAFRNYLAFKINKTTFRFRAMPFGLNIAHRIFTKLVGVVIKEILL